MNTQSAKVSHETKSSESKDKKVLERKWNRIVTNVSKAIANIDKGTNKPDESDIESLIDIRNQISDCEKSLDCFTSEIDSFVSDLDDGKDWNDLLSDYFDKIKSNQEKLLSLILYS